MPYCSDLRWHKTQDGADACVKHFDDEDFDNLSTLSRTRSASHRLSSNPKRSGHIQTALSAATSAHIPSISPSIDQTDNQPAHDPTPPPILGSSTPPPMDYHDDEVDRAPAIDQILDRIPETPPQPALGVGASKVPGWLDSVNSDPDQVPADNFEHLQQTPVHDRPSSIDPQATQLPETPPPRQLNLTTPPTHPLPIRMGKKPPEQDDTPSKLAIDERAHLAGLERPWYQEPNFLMTQGAAIWGGVGGVLFMVCVFWYAVRDGMKFP